jgi:hypothetical protein
MAENRFLTLPRELRDLIYAHILPEKLYLVAPDPLSSRTLYTSNGILLTSRALRAEALSALQRLLPTTTIVATQHARVPPLSLSTECGDIRRNIENLVILMSCEKLKIREFSLLPTAGWHTKAEFSEVLEAMPGLKEVTFEISWSPVDAYTLLWPSHKTRMLEVLRGVVGGEAFWENREWEVDARVRDATRWRNNWGGVVVMTKRKTGC